MRHSAWDVSIGSGNIFLPGEWSVSLWVVWGDQLRRRNKVGTCVEKTCHREARLVVVHNCAMKNTFVSSIADCLHSGRSVYQINCDKSNLQQSPIRVQLTSDTVDDGLDALHDSEIEEFSGPEIFGRQSVPE